VRDDLSHVKDVELVGFSSFFGNELDIPCPRWEVALLNVLEQILLREIFISTCHCCRFFGSKIFNALVGLEVIFDIVDLSLVIYPFVSVRAVSIYMSVTIRSTSVREKNGDLVERLRSVGPEIEHSVGISQVGLRVSLLGVKEVRELHWVLNEENWSIVANHIVVAFFSVKLDGKSSGVSSAVSGASFTSYSGESQEQGRSLSDAI
jgi:hypothetical protein